MPHPAAGNASSHPIVFAKQLVCIQPKASDSPKVTVITPATPFLCQTAGVHSTMSLEFTQSDSDHSKSTVAVLKSTSGSHTHHTHTHTAAVNMSNDSLHHENQLHTQHPTTSLCGWLADNADSLDHISATHSCRTSTGGCRCQCACPGRRPGSACDGCESSVPRTGRTASHASTTKNPEYKISILYSQPQAQVGDSHCTTSLLSCPPPHAEMHPR